MLNYTRIRPDVIESLQRYAETGCPTGGFLQAVLENDLKEACGRADEDNQRALFDIVGYIYNELPSTCWGSPQKVEDWLEEHRAERRRQEAEAER
jgi:hypothetical protein